MAQHHRSILPKYILLAAIFAFVSLNLCAAESKYVQSELGEDAEWAAQKWTADELKQFGGEPREKGDKSARLLVRCSFYVSEYDTKHLNPVWVAHIDTKESAAAAALRTK